MLWNLFHYYPRVLFLIISVLSCFIFTIWRITKNNAYCLCRHYFHLLTEYKTILLLTWKWLWYINNGKKKIQSLCAICNFRRINYFVYSVVVSLVLSQNSNDLPLNRFDDILHTSWVSSFFFCYFASLWPDVFEYIINWLALFSYQKIIFPNGVCSLLFMFDGNNLSINYYGSISRME